MCAILQLPDSPPPEVVTEELRRGTLIATLFTPFIYALLIVGLVDGHYPGKELFDKGELRPAGLQLETEPPPPARGHSACSSATLSVQTSALHALGSAMAPMVSSVVSLAQRSLRRASYAGAAVPLIAYTLDLDWAADLGLAQMDLSATTERDRVTRYTVWLALVREDGERLAVRIYDYTHGFNEEHRCDLQGRHHSPGRRFHEGTAAEGFLAARRLIADGA
jgi:hypothetical protein